MKALTKIFIVCLFLSSSLFVFSQNMNNAFGFDIQATELMVNGEKIKVQNLPQNGFVEVYNILGSRIMSFQINGGRATTRINLPRGYYILKSDEGTRKIVVK